MHKRIICTAVLTLLLGCSRKTGDILEIHIGNYVKGIDGLYTLFIVDTNAVLTSKNIATAEYLGAEPPSPWEGVPGVGKLPKLTEDAPDDINMFSIRFTDEGRKMFDEITAKNRKKYCVMISEGRQIAACVIMAHITNGEARITGHFTESQGRRIVRKLNK